MTTIRRIVVDWMEGFANSPEWRVYVDRLPDVTKFVFEERDGMFVSRPVDGFVRFFHYIKPGEGFGGRVFELQMVDGSTKKLYGPWSSRAACVGLVGFPAVADVVVYEEEGEYPTLGFAGFGLLVKELVKHAPCRVAAVRHIYRHSDPSDEINYEPLPLKNGDRREILEVLEPE